MPKPRTRHPRKIKAKGKRNAWTLFQKVDTLLWLKEQKEKNSKILLLILLLL